LNLVGYTFSDPAYRAVRNCTCASSSFLSVGCDHCLVSMSRKMLLRGALLHKGCVLGGPHRCVTSEPRKALWSLSNGLVSEVPFPICGNHVTSNRFLLERRPIDRSHRRSPAGTNFQEYPKSKNVIDKSDPFVHLIIKEDLVRYAFTSQNAGMVTQEPESLCEPLVNCPLSNPFQLVVPD
jgi:hypothetical protein